MLALSIVYMLNKDLTSIHFIIFLSALWLTEVRTYIGSSEINISASYFCFGKLGRWRSKMGLFLFLKISSQYSIGYWSHSLFRILRSVIYDIFANKSACLKLGLNINRESKVLLSFCYSILCKLIILLTDLSSPFSLL